jgi:hypothetical protein
MWQIQDNKIRLDVKKVRTKFFNIVSENNLHLIYPKKNMWDWEEDEKWLRSIVVDDDGFVVSCSWKKFGNYGEFQNDAATLNECLKNNSSVNFTHKEDGSLCIRYVYNNEVFFRTRGTLFGGHDGEKIHYGKRFKKVATEKYPKLLDPNWMNDKSLLFEFISPDNFIAIRYFTEDLIFLGFVKHNDLHIGTWEEITEISKDGNLNLVRAYDLSHDPNVLLEEIKTWKDEGIVIRCNNDQTFVKMKSASYLAAHRMKYNMNYVSIVEFIQRANIANEEQFVKELRKCDYDWEIIASANMFYHKFLYIEKIKDEYLELAKSLTEEFILNNPIIEDEKLRKKNFAKIACSQHKFVSTLMFLLYANKNIELACNRFIITEGGK